MNRSLVNFCSYYCDCAIMQGVNVVTVNDADFPVDLTYIDPHTGDYEEKIIYKR